MSNLYAIEAALIYIGFLSRAFRGIPVPGVALQDLPGRLIL
jgi:hypothetical protein